MQLEDRHIFPVSRYELEVMEHQKQLRQRQSVGRDKSPDLKF